MLRTYPVTRYPPVRRDRTVFREARIPEPKQLFGLAAIVVNFRYRLLIAYGT